MDVFLVVEDELGEAVMRRILSLSGHLTVYQASRRGGITQIRSNLDVFRNASKAVPHILLVDLDRNTCAPQLLRDWKFDTGMNSNLMLRVAVRETESWLLADRDGIAKFLNIPVTKVPLNPEELNDPKLALVNLARKSRNKRFGAEMIPADGSSAQVGVLYNSHLSNFIREEWDVEAARAVAPSLNRAIDRLSNFNSGW